MLSTPPVADPNQQPKGVIDPEIILAARADRVAAPQGADAARRSERQGPRPADIPVPAVDTSLRVADTGAEDEPAERTSIATWAVRTVVAILFAVVSAVGAAAWQTYGDQAQEMAARWIPHISLSSTFTGKTPAEPTQASTDSPTKDSQSTTADAAPAQPTPAAASAPTATAAAVPPSDQTQLLQSMAHDLAAMGQQITDLKASIAQLKTGQDQMAREIARLSEKAERTSEARSFDPRAIEQTLRPRPAPRPATAATGAAPAAAPVHRPRPAAPPAQSVSAPPTGAAPMPLQSAPAPQATADSDGNSVVRPPMPVR
ncbi:MULTISPECIES: hypothetical protein [unclassified Bradyrhizobium]|uniref:hypothetical protein n=1 Tax=unclassified Bradyrhizobium TaxID=2631580 RepID=UPI0028E31086|nr:MULTISPECIES: hypothetical protein [unclassified Bradyrhizobium]